jgi:hypothetical protein
MMMVVMTMVDANWHLSHNLRMQARGLSNAGRGQKLREVCTFTTSPCRLRAKALMVHRFPLAGGLSGRFTAELD